MQYSYLFYKKSTLSYFKFHASEQSSGYLLKEKLIHNNCFGISWSIFAGSSWVQTQKLTLIGMSYEARKMLIFSAT